MGKAETGRRAKGKGADSAFQLVITGGWRGGGACRFFRKAHSGNHTWLTKNHIGHSAEKKPQGFWENGYGWKKTIFAKNKIPELPFETKRGLFQVLFPGNCIFSLKNLAGNFSWFIFALIPDNGPRRKKTVKGGLDALKRRRIKAFIREPNKRRPEKKFQGGIYNAQKKQMIGLRDSCKAGNLCTKAL